MATWPCHIWSCGHPDLSVGQSQFMQSCRGILVWLQVSTACIQHVFNVCIQHGAQHMHPTHAHNGRV